MNSGKGWAGNVILNRLKMTFPANFDPRGAGYYCRMTKQDEVFVTLLPALPRLTTCRFGSWTQKTVESNWSW